MQIVQNREGTIFGEVMTGEASEKTPSSGVTGKMRCASKYILALKTVN